jgi:ribose 5-phosphate isomerase B
MMIAIGSDHGGLNLKTEIINYFQENNIKFLDVGTFSIDSVDYPDFAEKAVCEIQSGSCDRAILICGTGIGISISANKFKGIRCALCCDSYMAKMSREHNDANILALGGRVLGSGLAIDIVDTWLNTSYTNETKHANRLNKIIKIEDRQGIVE